MRREPQDKCLASPSAHAMRAAAVRLARERAGQDTDPCLAYGCVDWFRYDATPAPAHDADAAAAPLSGRTRALSDAAPAGR
jgi:hypothetical protein